MFARLEQITTFIVLFIVQIQQAEGEYVTTNMRKLSISFISILTAILFTLTGCQNGSMPPENTIKNDIADQSEPPSQANALTLETPNTINPDIVEPEKKTDSLAEPFEGAIQEAGQVNPNFSDEPVLKLLESQPANGWYEAGRINLDNAGGRPVTVRLYGNREENSGEITAFLDHEGTLLGMGLAGYYGIEKVEISQYDLTNDGINELILMGELGATASITKVYSFDSSLDQWYQLLETGFVQYIELDENPGWEIVSTSIGSLPPHVLIYKWNGKAYEKLDVAVATGNDYAYLLDAYPIYWIAAGKIEAGKSAETHYYALRNNILVEYPKGFVQRYDYILPDSGKRLLSEGDLEGLYSYYLNLSRNEIFARHGYNFASTEYADYFGLKHWYYINPDYNESMLNDIEKQNAALIKKREEKLEKCFTIVEDNTASADLNGDGKNERIKLEGDSDQFRLTVNDRFIEGTGDNLDGLLFLCDINEQDPYKEIAVTESGPSSDSKTAFYYYDGNNIIFMGKIQGNQDVLQITGSGTFITRSRGDILQTWFYTDRYKLSADHQLVNIPQELYKMDTPVTVRKKLSLQQSPTDSDTALVLNPGEIVIITACDNKEWCLVEKPTGEKGWFAIDNYSTVRGTGLNASDYFEGLCYAD